MESSFKGSTVEVTFILISYEIEKKFHYLLRGVSLPRSEPDPSRPSSQDNKIREQCHWKSHAVVTWEKLLILQSKASEY